MEGPKQGLSIKVAPNIYKRLKEEIGKGKINSLIERAIVKELDERAKKVAQEKKEFQQQLIKDYKVVASSKKRRTEDEVWDETSSDGLE
jgi:hypothetical protein